MREIKFRAWHTGRNKMFSCEEMTRDQLTLLPDGRFINVSGTDVRLSEIYPNNKIIPLQFTGLKDKNGKEIYEGDILRKNCSPQQGVVEFSDGCFVINYGNDSNFIACRNVFEIIGNIYENPELLEVK